MTATSLRTGLVALALASAACELPPAGARLDPGEPAEVDCSACHVVEDLFVPVSDEAPGDWMAREGRGVVRDPGVLSLDGAPLISFPWSRRGSHGPAEREGCQGCHPVYRRTSGHGLAGYSEQGERAAFRGGEDCAAACHGWLPADATALGFSPSSGPTSSHRGSLRPGDLLAEDAAAGGGHGRLWSRGYVEADDDERAATLGLRVARLEAGCGGCHNRFDSTHGAIAVCTDCHDLDSSDARGGHERHVARIGDEVDRRAPAFAEERACSFCHCGSDAPEALCRAACLSCHLGGHGPRPVLWNVSLAAAR